MHKTPTGISGLDDVTGGGLPRGRSTLTPHDATVQRFEDELAARDESVYDLTLFVSGASDLAARAIANARKLCDAHLHGRSHLSVVDVHEATAVLTSRLLATPTLVRNLPLPVRRVVGDLSHTGKVLRALVLPVTREEPPAPG